jgi:hypothetical protein
LERDEAWRKCEAGQGTDLVVVVVDERDFDLGVVKLLLAVNVGLADRLIASEKGFQVYFPTYTFKTFKQTCGMEESF